MRKLLRGARVFALNQIGSIDPGRLIGLMCMAFVIIMFILNFVPELETAIAGSTIQNTFVNSFLGIMVWALPVAGLIAVLIGMFQTSKSKRG